VVTKWSVADVEEGKKMRVLLVDDQVWLRSALRLLLEHEPNLEVVGEVANASAVPASTASLHPDLILLDWELPDTKTTGARHRLITALRALQPQVYIIALTSSQEGKNAHLATGVDAFVSKAEPPNALLAAIQQAQAAYRPKLRA
jgi:DNA-binding NarL/FixJ family response regulator